MSKEPKTAKQQKAEVHVVIKELALEQIGVRIEGMTSLITNPWTDKAKEQMLLAQQGGKKTKIRDVRDPQADFDSASYRLSDGSYGFPLTSIKNAIVEVAHVDTGVPKTTVRRAMFIEGDEGILCRLDIPGPPKMREDVVRVSRGGTDLRYRPEHTEWAIDLRITYDTSLLNAETIFNLIERAGFGIGIGEWRPQKSGEFGRFRVARGD